MQVNSLIGTAIKELASGVQSLATQDDGFVAWRDIAREKQLPPDGDWLIWLLMTGRGFGKTRSGAEWVIERAMSYPHSIALVGETAAEVRNPMIEVSEASIMECARPSQRPEYIPTKRRLIFPNGSIATTYSGDKPRQLRGPEHGTAWMDEWTKYKYPDRTLDNLLMGLRKGDDPRLAITNTPRPIPALKELIKLDEVALVTGTTWENKDNLSDTMLAFLLKKYKDTYKGRQELEGLLIDDMPGALWKRSDIDDNRVDRVPREGEKEENLRDCEMLKRIVVALDPEATSSEQSSQTGIIVGGLGYDNEVYIIADRTTRGSPGHWGGAAIDAYFDFSSDLLVGEANNGGDMIEYVLRSVAESQDVTIQYRKIWASRGKRTRAEPIAAMYEQGRVHHVGAFSELEDQMCNWVPGDDSPDRMDALVWCVTELMSGRGAEPEIADNPFY